MLVLFLVLFFIAEINLYSFFILIFLLFLYVNFLMRNRTVSQHSLFLRWHLSIKREVPFGLRGAYVVTIKVGHYSFLCSLFYYSYYTYVAICVDGNRILYFFRLWQSSMITNILLKEVPES